MLALEITSVVILPVLALAFYAMHRSRPGRFRLTVKLLRLLDIGIEVDAQDRPDGLPAVPDRTSSGKPELPAG